MATRSTQRKELIMAVIAPIALDAHKQLIEPGFHDEAVYNAIERLRNDWVRFPTFDIGYTHVYTLQGQGRTQAQAQEQLAIRIQRYCAKMSNVEGYAQLKLERSEFRTSSGEWTCMYQVMYVIRETGSREQRSRPPYPGYQQDMAAIGYNAECAAVLYE